MAISSFRPRGRGLAVRLLQSRRARLLLLALAAAGGAQAQSATEAPVETLSPIVVNGRPDPVKDDGGFASALGGVPIERTPLAVQSITALDLADRGVDSLSSAIRTLPSVGDNYNTFGYIEALQIRGFVLNEFLNYQRDGMSVSSHVPVAFENKERLDILQGAAGMMQGASAPGGLVNYVLKQPTDQDLVQIDSTVGERGSALLHADLGGRAGADHAFGYRINLAAEERRPEIDGAWSHRWLASAFLDWRAAPGTLVQLEFEHQQVSEISVPGFALLDVSGVPNAQGANVATVLPPPIDPRINLNQQPWTQPFQSVQTTGSVRLRQQLGDRWDLRVLAGTQRSATNDRIAFPDGCSYFNSTLNAASQSYYLYNGLCGNYNVDVYQYISDDEVRNMNNTDTRLQGHFALGATDHVFTLDVRTTRYTERYPLFQTYNLVSSAPPALPVFNVFNPVPLPANGAATTRNVPLDTDLDEVAAFDVARLAGTWSTWAGARLTRITESSSLTDGSQAARLQQHLITPWIGLGDEPWQGGFAYATVGGGIEVANAPNHPSVTVAATGNSYTLANPGQALPAQRSHQEELGFKQTGARASLEVAAFRIVKPFVDNVPIGGGAALQVAGARVERHQGIETTARWRPDGAWQWRAALTVLDARTTQAADPSWIGKAATNVAPLAASLQAIWSPAGVPGLAWSNLGSFAAHKPVLPNGAVDLPNAWQWDTSWRYEYRANGMRWTWRAGIDNVTDHRYWREAPTATWGSIYLYPAAARTGRIGVSAAW